MSLTWTVLERLDDHMRINLRISPLNQSLPSPWLLAFTWPRIVIPQSLSAGHVQIRQGSFYEFSHMPPCDLGNVVDVQFTAQGPLEKTSDMPDGFYFKFAERDAQVDQEMTEGSGDQLDLATKYVLGDVELEVGELGWTDVTPEPERYLNTQPRSCPVRIIPYPETIQVYEDQRGTTLQSHCTILSCRGGEAAAAFIASLPGKVTFKVREQPSTDSGVLLPGDADVDALVAQDPADDTSELKILMRWADVQGDEAYELDIRDGRITIRGSHTTGLLYGLVSCYHICQGYDADSSPDEGANHIPRMTICDRPRFRVRQTMLDVSRHFRPLPEIKRFLDQMALFKLNTFHWHLTDDEGWRLEIKGLPQLTDIGAWRGDSMPIKPQLGGTGYQYGGFFTRQDVQELVAYAHDRGITIVPEIDIPGHCFACINSLPELSDPEDESGNVSVQLFANNTLNPGLEATFRFLDTVLGEVAEMFPGPYVHMGSDEVPKGVWEKSPAALAKAKELSLPDVRLLVGVIMRYAQDVLHRHSKRMMAWQEVLEECDVDKSTIVCSWQSCRAGREAASEGYDVIMAPAQYFYMDMAYSIARDEPGLYWAGTVNLYQTYMYEPLSEMDDQAQSHIIGALAPLWGELVHTRDHMDYMFFPRLLAFAENAWTPAKDWPGFVGRVAACLPTLDMLGVKYRQFRNVG